MPHTVSPHLIRVKNNNIRSFHFSLPRLCFDTMIIQTVFLFSLSHFDINIVFLTYFCEFTQKNCSILFGTVSFTPFSCGHPRHIFKYMAEVSSTFIPGPLCRRCHRQSRSEITLCASDSYFIQQTREAASAFLFYQPR